MAFRNIALFVLVIAAAALPARAEFYAKDKTSTDPNRPAIEALAKEFAATPASFGCPEFAWGQKNDESTTTMEFVPAGDDVKKWTRMTTVTTLALPPKEADRAAIVKRLQAIMLSNYSQHGTVLDTQEGKDAKGSPTIFVEYEIGQGKAKEHNAAAIVKLRPDLAGIVQIQSRGKRLTPEDVAKMQTFAQIKKN
jgi:hypothetical protein